MRMIYKVGNGQIVFTQVDPYGRIDFDVYENQQEILDDVRTPMSTSISDIVLGYHQVLCEDIAGIIEGDGKNSVVK